MKVRVMFTFTTIGEDALPFEQLVQSIKRIVGNVGCVLLVPHGTGKFFSDTWVFLSIIRIYFSSSRWMASTSM